MAKNTTGTIATQMANAPLPTAHSPILFTIGGFGMEAKPSEWTPKSGAYTSKRTAYATVVVGGLEFPAEISVLFYKDAAKKPDVVAKLPTIRFRGGLFSPRSGLSKSESVAVQTALDAFEKQMAREFIAWHRQQDGLPALTSRVTTAGSTAVELDD